MTYVTFLKPFKYHISHISMFFANLQIGNDIFLRQFQQPKNFSKKNFAYTGNLITAVSTKPSSSATISIGFTRNPPLPIICCNLNLQVEAIFQLSKYNNNYRYRSTCSGNNWDGWSTVIAVSQEREGRNLPNNPSSCLDKLNRLGRGPNVWRKTEFGIYKLIHQRLHCKKSPFREISYQKIWVFKIFQLNLFKNHLHFSF